MEEPLTTEERASLLAKYTNEVVSGDLSAQQKALREAEARRKRNNRQFTDKEGSRPPVVSRKPAVFSPKGFFPKGRADKGPEEAKY